jgi:MGT family glycosyltransferase
MAKHHIAVFTPLSVGHVYPALDVCSELVRRGNRVTYPASERFAPKIRETGAEAIEFKSLEFSYPEKLFRYPSSEDSGYWRMFASVVGAQLIASATATLTELEAFYASNPPDLILYEWFSFAGRIFAKHFNCPAIQICAHFAHHDALIRVNEVCTTPAPMLEFSRALDSFMSLFGFAGAGHLWHAEPVNLFFIPREFQYDASSFDERFRFVGATHGRSSRAPVWKNAAGKQRPMVLISETTSSNDDRFLNLCIEAFGDSKYHVVFSKGAYSADVSRARLPGNFEINLEVRNREILPSADVMVCQGGMGTTLESLYYGVPVVAVPPTPWHSEVAYRMAELGLGLQVPADGMTPGVLRNAVYTAASDEALLVRVKCMQDELRNNPGGRAAADAIEEYLKRTAN